MQRTGADASTESCGEIADTFFHGEPRLVQSFTEPGASLLFLKTDLRVRVNTMAESDKPIADGVETFSRCGFWLHECSPLLWKNLLEKFKTVTSWLRWLPSYRKVPRESYQSHRYDLWTRSEQATRTSSVDGQEQKSRSSTIGHITLGTKQTGAPSAGNPHAGCDVAEAGNGFTVWLMRHSQRKRGATARLDLRNTAPVLDPTGMSPGTSILALRCGPKHSKSEMFFGCLRGLAVCGGPPD
jgi:hypothetical protein